MAGNMISGIISLALAVVILANVFKSSKPCSKSSALDKSSLSRIPAPQDGLRQKNNSQGYCFDRIALWGLLTLSGIKSLNASAVVA